MKKFFTQILTAIGFIVALVGIILSSNYPASTLLFSSFGFVCAMLATAFVFAKNATVKNMGYVLSAVAAATGISMITVAPHLYALITYAGLAIMIVPAIIYVVIEFFSWCGFTRKSKVNANCGDLVSALNQYKELEKASILSADEFESLKSRALKSDNAQISSVDDLKQWKKLFDQEIITADEFSALKANLFNNK